jgi:hypothetical protein
MAFAQSFKCSIYAGAGGTPLPYTTILQAKSGYCLNERLRLEVSIVGLRDEFEYARRLQLYSLGLRYQFWGGWYALLGPAFANSTIESEDHNFHGERTAVSLETGIGYEWYWDAVPIFLNLDLVRRQYELSHTIEYRVRVGELPADLSKEDDDLNVEKIIPLMLSIGIYI